MIEASTGEKVFEQNKDFNILVPLYYSDQLRLVHGFPESACWNLIFLLETACLINAVLNQHHYLVY